MFAKERHWERSTLPNYGFWSNNLFQITYSKTFQQSGVSQLLVETHEDGGLLEEVTRLSPNVPVSDALVSAVQGNSIREHRRRVLSKTNPEQSTKLPGLCRLFCEVFVLICKCGLGLGNGKGFVKFGKDFFNGDS